MESLKAKTTRGIFWSLSDSFGVYAVKFGFSIAIARTLSTEDYGLMGMIVIFIAFGQMIMQSGFSMALVQKKECSAEDLSTAFWFNFLTGLLVYFILFFSAGAIADFYSEPILIDLTRVAAIGIIINSLCSVQVSILTRRMDFRSLTLINMTGALISGITGLFLALKGHAVWALVFQTLAGNVIYLLGLSLSSKWRPTMVINTASFRSLFNFGYKISLQGLTEVIFTKLYFPLIGRFFSASQLGFYSNANRFYELVVRQTSVSFNRAVFPAFSSINDERDRFAANYVKSFGLLFHGMSLMTILCLAGARPFVSLFLTDKWLPAVPFMTAFFIEGFYFPLLLFNQNIFNTMGRSAASLKIDIVKKTLTMVSIFLLFRFGIRALILGQVISTFLAFILSFIAVYKTLKTKYSDLMYDILKIALVVTICLASDKFFINGITASDAYLLILKALIIPALYIVLSYLLKINALRDARSLIGPHIGFPGKGK
jgi:O-antigen/teichoic acid export membrane protein